MLTKNKILPRDIITCMPLQTTIVRHGTTYAETTTTEVGKTINQEINP